ncbi:MAG: hypothetical protein IT204_19045 [Fimbriimonadaceae bacterium]|nr:hypothetical protein [Fimbriimonadaceae bacterium]
MSTPTPAPIPAPGQVVRLRMRTYLTEAVDSTTGHGALVRLSCLDDDAQGQPLEVIWELEPEAQILDEEAWQSIGARGFDAKSWFSAYLHTLRWNCVTATEPRLFQSPFRAGIKLDAYQLEPLRKALVLPRVSLFIADDVGLGKTIEAGLIASELLLRRRVREIVVACPPSMIPQWQEEMESRFGLTFEVLDREYVDRIRREHGFGANPWLTYPRFIVSHKLLIDESYAGPLRAWLGELRTGSLLILDEAHHAAPASSSRYAIDSRITRAIRDLAPHFEHRLFLSATPHNGHSNSFSALLELLDPDRFVRGVQVLPKNRDQVMVRRLKDDIRALQGGFPERAVRQVDLAGLPPDAPELRLSELLNAYRDVRQRRVAAASKRQQAQAALLLSGLQQRLLSSVEAFARTLAVHRRTMERLWAGEATTAGRCDQGALVGAGDPDDDCAALDDADRGRLEEVAFERATLATAGTPTSADVPRERQLLDEMVRIAESTRGLPDARVRHLIAWVREHLCAGARLPDEPSGQRDARWSDRRLLIFTEYEDTRRWLVGRLREAVRGTDLAEQRLDFYSGATSMDRRRAIQRAFNLAPAEHPLRILVATDAAREGLNLQAHCSHLFHFDVPWNPARLEQRNGRIDRKLQPRDKVFCHYFVYTQRPEDRVLRTLVQKTETIRAELGSLSQVLEKRLADMLQQGGIRHAEVARITADIQAIGPDPERQAVVDEELEATRLRRADLQREIDTLRTYLDSSRRRIGLDEGALRDALSCSLEMLRVKPLAPADTPSGEPQRFVFPNLDTRHGSDPGWAGTLDTLRELPEDGDRTYQWRQQKPLRPVVFQPPPGLDDDVVQLHLSHRVVQRLLSRFTAQGFVYHDLSRACLAQSEDSIPRVVLIGRLALYGRGAVRLHEEVLTVTARWTAPEVRHGTLAPYAREAEGRTLDLLEAALKPGPGRVAPTVAARFEASVAQDIGELLPHLSDRGAAAQVDATRRLADRGRIEAEAMADMLDQQKRRVLDEQAKLRGGSPQGLLPGALTAEEERQLEANRRAWERWLGRFDDQRAREPERIREFYEVTSSRLEPVGLAYLWPVTG